jgi:hypothetical protein
MCDNIPRLTKGEFNMSEETIPVLEEVHQELSILPIDNQTNNLSTDPTVREPTIEEIKRRIRLEKITDIYNRSKDEFNNLLIEASEIQNKITTAKTKTKKDLYGKKMVKVRHHMHQVIGVLQQLETLTKQSEGSDDVIAAAE